MHRHVLAMALACLCLTGCGLFKSSGDIVRNSLRRPNGGDLRDEGTGTIDSGRTAQMQAIRGTDGYDEPDILASPTARDINRSLGATP